MKKRDYICAVEYDGHDSAIIFAASLPECEDPAQHMTVGDAVIHFRKRWPGPGDIPSGRVHVALPGTTMDQITVAVLSGDHVAFNIDALALATSGKVH